MIATDVYPGYMYEGGHQDQGGAGETSDAAWSVLKMDSIKFFRIQNLCAEPFHN